MFKKGLWNYDHVDKRCPYGEITSYKLGLAFLDGHGDIEDWGSGMGFAKTLVEKSNYVGIDFTPSKFADKIEDLLTYTSSVDCIFMRHVLEHNHEWKKILENAVKSFKKRMVIILFTPLSEGPTHTLNGNPDYSFYLPDITDCLKDCKYTVEPIKSKTQYSVETVIYIEKIVDPKVELKEFLDSRPYDKYCQDVEYLDFEGHSKSHITWGNIKDLVDWKGRKVADLGCFHGYYSFKIEQEGGIVTGFDRVDSVLELPRKIKELIGSKVNFALWEGGQEVSAEYDISLLIGVLQFFPDKDLALRNIHSKTVIFDVLGSEVDVIKQYYNVLTTRPSWRDKNNIILLCVRKEGLV